MENQNHESKFEGTPEIESLNIADIELLYQKLEEEDAELYSGGILPYYLDGGGLDSWCPVDRYGGQCPYAFSECSQLIACIVNTDGCDNLSYCNIDCYIPDGCPENDKGNPTCVINLPRFI